MAWYLIKHSDFIFYLYVKKWHHILSLKWFNFKIMVSLYRHHHFSWRIREFKNDFILHHNYVGHFNVWNIFYIIMQTGSESQEILYFYSLLCTQKLSPLGPVKNQRIPAQTSHISLRLILMLFSYLHLGLAWNFFSLQ
jgi:hypothetical protein